MILRKIDTFVLIAKLAQLRKMYMHALVVRMGRITKDEMMSVNFFFFFFSEASIILKKVEGISKILK